MMSMNHVAVKNTLILTLSCACLSLTACSKNASWVTGASLSTSTQNGDEYVQLSTQLNTGAIGLIPIMLPVINPHNPTQVIGEITIKSGLGSGTSELDLAVNMSAVLSLPSATSAGLLPNGTVIPVTGVDPQNWFSFPVAAGLSRIYLNLDLQNKKVVMGTAINIDQLSVGVPADLLLPFATQNISGLAGVYTGAKGQSGFALFVDASQLLNSTTVATFAQKKKSEVQIQQKLYELNMNKTLLKVK